ncbi:hypothetical protein FACS1894122_09610 [Alphaproteobacteria bacterium]|nr:hypothetical protein FACS1894122_09610 [Alphaproteobacteria bacterium]
MSRKSGYVSVELEKAANAELKRLGSSVLVSRKLEAIIAACKYSISEVAKIYSITRKTLLFWIKNFQETRIEKLKAPPSRRRKSILDNSDRAVIKEIIDGDSQVTLSFLVQKMLELRGKKISVSSMQREVKKMRYSYITPRPQHYKQDVAKVAVFKKKINEELKKKPYDAILFSDEARFGTRTKIGHGWFKTKLDPLLFCGIFL